MSDSIREPRTRLLARSWIAVSALGAVLLVASVRDDWTGLWTPARLHAAVAENAVLVLLSLGLVAGGVWLGRRDWPPARVATAVEWTLGFAGATAVLYGVVVAAQLSVMRRLDAWSLVHGGVLVGAIVAFVAGVSNASRRQPSDSVGSDPRPAHLESAFASVDEYAVVGLDQDGVVTSWNDGAADLLDLTAADAVGTPAGAFFPEGERETDLPGELLSRARSDGQAHYEGWLERPDGTECWADVTVAARDVDGDPVGFVVLARDETERREREQAVEYERERLEFVNRIVRHNVLNGLNLVNARVGLIESRFAADSDAQEHVDVVRDRVEDLTDLLETIPAFTEAVVGDEERERQPIPIRSVLAEKVALARDSYPEAAFDVGELPAGDVRVVGDDLVGEVFENVLSNAVVHNDADDPEVEVWATRGTCTVPLDASTGAVVHQGAPRAFENRVVTREVHAVVVHVADNGPGIPDDEKDRVLEKGVSELSEPGNGFGLYLVTEMMRSYGGRVDVRDNDPTGAVFSLTFPRADAVEAAIPGESESAE
ncbi:MAG: ATP-binding protein [Halobacterium sp.]